MKFFIILALLFNSVPLFSLETNITLIFWTNHYPPGSSNYLWFREAKKSLNVLNANNEEIELVARSKQISLVSTNEVKRIVNKFLRDNPPKKEFVFYEFEKTQMILIIKMFLNHSRVYNKYSKKEALRLSKNFIFQAFRKIGLARYSAQKNANRFDNNYVLLTSMLGRALASQIRDIFRKY